MSYIKMGVVQGLFLSSAVPGNPDQVTNKMIETVKIIRFRYNFRGYIHLKALPGVSRENIRQLCSLADRVSLNLETPSKHFPELTSTKVFQSDLMKRISWLKDFEPSSGITTQFVVGAASESDAEILDMMDELYHKFSLRRIYFSAFEPVSGTPLEKLPAAPARREFRLYQADWLLRVYNFDHKAITSILTDDGFLPMDKDPKLTWAINNPELFPVDINAADFNQLLVVPGIGPQTAKKLLDVREKTQFKSFPDLLKAGIRKAAFPFVSVKGKTQARLSQFV